MEFITPVFNLLQHCFCKNNGNILFLITFLFIHGKISNFWESLVKTGI